MLDNRISLLISNTFYSHEIGFFLLRHDIPEVVCKRALNETNTFFQRSTSEKMTISYENSPAFRGYMPIGVENTEGKVDRRDQIEFAAEYNTQQQLKGEDDHFYNRLRATNQWPDEIQPTLRPAIMDYTSGVLDVADRIRDAMCIALNVDPSEVSQLFGVGDGNEPCFWSGKLVSYPPITSDLDNQSTEQGVGAHTDSNFLTFICQDSQSEGLQVQNVHSGGWIDVPKTDPDILICNIGELAEVWSAGYFLATPHRVLRHSSATHSRASLPIFYNPKIDAVVQPINIEKLPWERQQTNQRRREHNTLIKSVGENSFKSLARSHPKVFDLHHPDLRILDDGRIIKRCGKCRDSD